MTQSQIQSIAARASFDFVRYANCWEDADCVCAALRPAPGKRILSIASGGDNALALAAAGAEVVACDLSSAQLACVELKCLAIQLLDYDAVLQFFGLQSGPDRMVTYRKLRGELSPTARSFWDKQPAALQTGFIHCGKFEKYFALFRRRVLPLVTGRAQVAALLAERPLAEQKLFYERCWDTWRWRLLFRLFFSRFVLGRLGRDPEFFRYVTGSVSERILARTRYALTELSTSTNPYLQYILTGNYSPALPRYLRPDIFAQTRLGIARLKLVCAPIQQVARSAVDSGFDGYNLSDIFEYLSETLSSTVYGELLAAARPGARLIYWNMLVPRHCPAVYAGEVSELKQLSAELFQADRAFFYSALVVDEVRQCRRS